MRRWGPSLVLSADGPELVARHATTLALFVAGRLPSWGAPPVALVPALHILAAGGLAPIGGRVPTAVSWSA